MTAPVVQDPKNKAKQEAEAAELQDRIINLQDQERQVQREMGVRVAALQDRALVVGRRGAGRGCAHRSREASWCRWTTIAATAAGSIRCRFGLPGRASAPPFASRGRACGTGQ